MEHNQLPNLQQPAAGPPEPNAIEPAPELSQSFEQAPKHTYSPYAPEHATDGPPPPLPVMPTPSPFEPASFSPPPPPPPQLAAPSFDAQPQPGVVPVPVVQVLSPRGVEYAFLTIALFTGAIGLGSALISMVNGKFDFNVMAFPVALLVVALPVFAWLFLRLKNAELRDPSLRLDASKRRSTQLIQIISFVISFFTLIGFVSIIFAKLSGNYDGSIFKVLLDVLVVIGVAGGILAYYWRDEHRMV